MVQKIKLFHILFMITGASSPSLFAKPFTIINSSDSQNIIHVEKNGQEIRKLEPGKSISLDVTERDRLSYSLIWGKGQRNTFEISWSGFIINNARFIYPQDVQVGTRRGQHEQISQGITIGSGTRYA